MRPRRLSELRLLAAAGMAALLLFTPAAAEEPGGLDRLIDSVLDQQLARALDGKPPAPLPAQVAASSRSPGKPAGGGNTGAAPAGGAKGGGPDSSKGGETPRPATAKGISGTRIGGTLPNLMVEPNRRLSLGGFRRDEWQVRPSGQAEVELLGGQDLRLRVAGSLQGGLKASALGVLTGDFDLVLHIRPAEWNPEEGDTMTVELGLASAAMAEPQFVFRLTSGKQESTLEVSLRPGDQTLTDPGSRRSLLVRRRGTSMSLFAFEGAKGWVRLAAGTLLDPGSLALAAAVEKGGRAPLDMMLLVGSGKGLVVNE